MSDAAHSSTGSESGRTLIELMIALAIGAVLLTAVGAAFLSARGIARVAQQAGSAEHTARLVMTAIGDGIKAAGYGEIVGSDQIAHEQTLFDGASLRGCTGSRFADAFNAGSPDYSCVGTAPGDQLMVRFQGRYALVPMDASQLAGSALPDCLGASNAAQDAAMAASAARPGAGIPRRLVQSTFGLDAGGSVLHCHGNGNPGIPAPIANEVIEFRVFYRFDDAGFVLATGNQVSYAPLGGTLRDAAWINSTGEGALIDAWKHVVAVVVCLTVATREPGTSITSPAAPVTRCPRDVAEAAAGATALQTAPDGRLRRTFIETFTVRSQATAGPSIAL